MTVVIRPNTAALCWCGADQSLGPELKRCAPENVEVVRTASRFLEIFNTTNVSRVVLAGTPASEALRLISVVRRADSIVPIYVVLRDPRPEDVRAFLKHGATDVVWAGELDALFDQTSSEEPAGAASPGGKAPDEPPRIVCVNEKMRRVAAIVRRIGPTDSTVLIQGESGTGKELVAELIHRCSRRAHNPFITVNCGAIPEPLLESQLYGHERGSFTGAVKQQKGLFELADNGTIFLDEIGELSLEMQVKLLRFLQNREFRRIGGSRVIKVDVRVIAATNRDLKAEVARGRFRMDLYYRLNVISLALPPLRERPEEIPLLVDYFVQKLSNEQHIRPKTFAPEAIARLQRLPWPGNVRELENAVERLLLLSPGEQITEKDVEEYLDLNEAGGEEIPAVKGRSGEEKKRFLTLAELERMHIENVLRAMNWNKMRSARVLGINVKTLYNKIRAYGLVPPQGLSEAGESCSCTESAH